MRRSPVYKNRSGSCVPPNGKPGLATDFTFRINKDTMTGSVVCIGKIRVQKYVQYLSNHGYGASEPLVLCFFMVFRKKIFVDLSLHYKMHYL
jgi:hypothetical protein